MTKINYIVNFNNNQLNSINGVQVYSIDYFGNERTLNLFALARRNARKLTSAFYQAKKIYISVYITGNNRDNADQIFDTLMGYIQSGEGSLVIQQSGTVRQYTATFSKIDKNNSGTGRGIAQPPQGGFADITLEFECSDSYGYDTNYTLITNQSSLTSGNVNVAYTQGGSAEWQVPFIQAQYTALTGSAPNTVTVGNQATGQAIQVSRTWSAGDLLQVDSRNRTVQVNGLDVAFTGAFPEFNTGLQNLYIQDSFTTRTLKLYAYVYNRYV